MLTLRRLASRRGLSATITPDNAKAFKTSCKEICKIIRSKEVWRFLVDRRVKWQFIVERAPLWGGFWERLVRSVKRPLKRVVGRSTLSRDELNILLVEIEAVINARPLTYVYDDEESNYEPLTPSHLIYGRRITTSPNSSHHEVVSTNRSLTRRARHHKLLLEQFIKQWRTEYPTSLREQTSAAFWRLARVEQLPHGEDGKTRSAIIKLRGGNSSTTSIIRKPKKS